MNEVNLPAIEPVTDDDLRAAQNIGERSGKIRLVAILEQDRRRVAERQAPEIERLRAEVASLRALVGTVRDTLGLRTINVADIDCEAHSREIGAKVARLSAACGQMREALRQASTDLRTVGNDYPGSSCYEWCWKRADAADLALSTDAGKGWIDATGAVEDSATVFVPSHGVEVCASVPDAWAGSRVLIVRVAK